MFLFFCFVFASGCPIALDLLAEKFVSTELLSFSCQKSVEHICVGYSWVLCFVLFLYLSFFPLIVHSLYVDRLLLFYSFLKLCIFISLLFSMHFRIILPISAKGPTEILIRILLNVCQFREH